ncbi:MAG TPA: tRNA (adenosine(37)-N6)-threonylcarbamoyltransferase complex transferase subunit TsaD [Casimicrobiaceae bacterium]|nr:tRNA (adenosine(37)-N6)-threonylcarbamoyltransferase complex transferase subunit TsaD [Casimicrobiaceae bacterium]
MLVLGIETSCDETGVAVYDTAVGLRAHALHSQVAMHAAYGGVVPELASRDHVRRLVPLIEQVIREAAIRMSDLDGIAFTQGPGLAGALLVGASVATALGYALRKPVVPVHHLEGHLLSPLLAEPRPAFPFVALLVSGGHSQLFDVAGVGRYALLGDTLDDAAGEAFDKTAKLLGLPYPGGPELARLAESGTPGHVQLPRPMLDSGDLQFSFSGLKTAVVTTARRMAGSSAPEHLSDAIKADIALEFQSAVVEVLVAKSIAALAMTGRTRLVVAGGVGANSALREQLRQSIVARGAQVFFPELRFCTDNGAMIALAGALRLRSTTAGDYAFDVRPRWSLASLTSQGAPGAI